MPEVLPNGRPTNRKAALSSVKLRKVRPGISLSHVVQMKSISKNQIHH